MAELLKRLLREEVAQDVIEYALLTASIGLMGIAIWPVIATNIGLTYQEFDADTQEIWETPPPGTP